MYTYTTISVESKVIDYMCRVQVYIISKYVM